MKWIFILFFIYFCSYGIYYLITWSNKPRRKVTKSHNSDYDNVFDFNSDGDD